MSGTEASNDTTTGIALSEILFLQRTSLLGALPLSLEHGIFDPSDSPSTSKESAMRRKEHQIFIKPKISTRPPLKAPNTEFKAIDQKIYPKPSAVYNALVKPTLNGFPDIPQTPDIFKGLRYSPSRDIAVGDIDYSKKMAVEPKTHSSIPGTILRDRITDNKTASAPAEVVSTTLESSADSEVSEIDTSDNGVSLYPEPDTPQSPPITLAPKTMRNPDPLDLTNASVGPLKHPEDLHTKLRSPSESPVWSLDNCSGEAASKENFTSPRHEIEDHGPFNKSTSPPWKNHRELCNEFLGVKKYALRSEKEVQRLETRVRLLEKKVGIGKKPQKVKKNKRPLLVKGGDAKITRVIQHISHLIELRRFMEKLKKTGKD